MKNPFKLLQNLNQKPQMVPTDVITAHLSDEDKKLLQNIGITASQIWEKVHADTQINYDRIRFYNEVTKACEHWMVGPALELYADYATNYSQLHGASVWITSENPKYQKELTKLLDRIGTEEKIFDWGWTTAAYGDLFIKINGEPELGIISIDDDDHPMNMSRIDDEGSLIGFYKSPQGQSMDPQKILPPWQYVHMRLLGCKRKRPQFGDPQYSEFRCISGPTKIQLLDGTNPTIQEMAENASKYVGKKILSVNQQTKKLEVDEIIGVRKTRLNAQLVRVTLDNWKSVDCTPDHRFMMRDGSYREAKDLQPGDSLMPYYTRNAKMWPNESGLYTKVYNRLNEDEDIFEVSDKSFDYIHRLVAENSIGRKLAKGEVVHHIDVDSQNNEPNNLAVVSKSEHTKIHNQLKWNNPSIRKRIEDGIKEARQSGAYDDNAYLNHPEDCGCAACRNMRGEVIEHPADCGCFVCQMKRGIYVNFGNGGTGSHPADCGCFVCKSKRGERPDHKDGCNCGVCKAIRGETSNTLKNHKENCQCAFCKSKRGESPRPKNITPVNHKVIKVEWLQETADTYDLETKKNHNFPLAAGVFVHNSMHLMGSTDTKQVSSRYGCCVPGYILIDTDAGMIRISDIVSNKMKVNVKSLNLLTNKFEYKPIINWSRRTNDDGLIEIEIDSEPSTRIIKCTPDHPVLTSGRGWVKAKELTLSDKAIVEGLNSGVAVRIIDLVFDPVKGEVFDLEVQDNHNFLVSGAIVHNSIIINALPVYKRLRLSEDSLLMARLTRGIIRYIWKLSVDSCLRGDTKIELMDGTNPTIKEMAENQDKYIGAKILTFNSGLSGIGRGRETGIILDVKKTRLNAELVRITFQTGRTREESAFVDCTPDHPFMLRTGVYVEAKDLKIGHYLMPYKSSACPIVLSVEKLTEREDTYDITVDQNHNFPLTAGVFVHNSNAESTNELMTQLVGMLKKARAFDTSSSSPNFDSKFGPLSAVEDILIPVWGDTNNLTYDKIGGDADIHWITDIQELRNQLSCALRVPLSVLGGFTDEASGALGSQAIEKLSIEFAHSARRLQRAVKVGIKRMCQIHLAWMNLDPDPRLFEVNMSETSTAEEENIKNNLDTGVDVITKFMDAAEAADPNVDKKAIFSYLNQKILKLEDFDINDFLMAKGLEPVAPVEESKKADEDMYRPFGNTDLMAFLPIREKAPVCRLLNESREVVWNDLYGSATVKEVEAGAKIVETKENVEEAVK